MKNLTMMAMLTAMTTLTACDYIEKKEFEKERGDKGYQSAMADYSAGRLDDAVTGLKKVLKWNPSNSSARFQLACLQQDRVKDLRAALSNYVEYLAQEPNSDKAQLAKDRLDLCEKDFAKVLAKKYGIISSAEIAEEYQRLEEDVKRLTAKSAANQKELTELNQELANLRSENERLKKQFTSIGLDEKDLAKRKIDKAAILDEIDSNDNASGFSDSEIAALKAEGASERGLSADVDKSAFPNEEEKTLSLDDTAKALKGGSKVNHSGPSGVDVKKGSFADDDIASRKLDDAAVAMKGEKEDKGGFDDDVSALRDEEEEERGLDEAAVYFKGEQLSEEDKVAPIKVDKEEYARKQAQKAKEKAEKEKAEKEKRSARSMVTSFSSEEVKEKKPATYVVQEGDTLYKIAVKFYGRSSAWQIIREANKESVSTDGRVRAGQVLRLP